LLEADNVKTEFISNITHELLTPLTSIRGFVELLEDETMGKINAEQKKSLEIILRNCDRLIKLIKELLDTSNLENNKLGFQFGLVSLNSILSKTIHDIHPQANDKQITIIKDIQQLPEIWGDEERLVQVLMNLLINAIKFTPHKGKITIKAKGDIEHINISISDTGIGIPADKLNSIFDRFYQVDGSARRKYGGMGLGLSICRSIIDKHFGKIWAQSDGKGSTFHIVLPKLKYKSGENYV
jgi:signal transduction histidine kinase